MTAGGPRTAAQERPAERLGGPLPGEPDWALIRSRRTVLVLSVCFLVLFAGFNDAQGLQSSLNGVLGFVNLGTLYLTFSLCCISAPAVIHRLEKRGLPMRGMLLIAGMVYVSMVLVGVHPIPNQGESGYTATVALNIFLSFMVGVVAPILWTIQNIYVSRCALVAAKSSAQPGEAEGDAVTKTTSAFNGLFFTFLQFSGVLGPGAGSLVLLLDRGGGSRITLFAVLGAMSFAGALGFLALPALPAAPTPGASVATPSGGEEAAAATPGCTETLGLLFADRRVSLMVPLIFTNGCFLGFAFGDYQKSFVTATLGPDFAGPALLTFYGVNSAASAAWGALILKGRLRVWTVLLLAFLLQLAVLVLVTLSSAKALPLFKEHYEFHSGESADVHKEWVLKDGHSPAPWEYVAPFACIAVASLGDAAYESQSPAVLQAFFRDERVVPAMANYKLFQSLGFAAQFVVSAAVPGVTARTAALAVLFVLSFAALAFLDRRVAPISGAGPPSQALLGPP